jgi:hypothetical protein
VSDTVEKVKAYAKLEDKLSLLIYLQNFLKSGEDVDGNSFENGSGGVADKGSVQELIGELEKLEESYLDELGEL